MAEILIALAILALLAAVAIPSVAAVRQNLDMTELDATARSIFSASQDNLAGLRNSGGLDGLNAAPQSALSGESSDIRFLTGGDALMSTLLPSGAVEPIVEGGHYLIQFNCASGILLEVYFSREPLPSADSLFAMAGMEHAARQARRSARIGYYAGDDVAVTKAEPLPTPSVTVENGDTLTVTVTVPDAAVALTRADLFLTVLPADGSSPGVTTPLGFSDLVTGRATATLDSLEAGSRFSVLYPRLTPGADLLVSAALVPKPPSQTGGKVYLGAESAGVRVNSLFAGRETRAGVETALIANGRHLQNLCTALSGADSTIRAAAQTTAFSWDGRYLFRPIENPSLTCYDGASLPITGLKIAGGTYGGLFGSLSATAPDYITLRGITIVNAVVSGASDSQGTLVGQGSRLLVENCAVYVSVLRPSGGGYEYDYAAYPRYSMDSSARHTGGLIGFAQNCTVKNSSAALPLISISAGASFDLAAGGLIGTAKGCAVSGSYAAVDQLGGNATMNGMLIGRADSATTVTHCYATGNMLTAGILDVATLSGLLCGEAAVSDSYCAVTYLDSRGNNRTDKRYALTSAGSASHCAYLDTGTSTVAPDGAVVHSYDALKAWGSLRPGWTTVTARDSYPYSQSLSGRTYPFPALSRPDGRTEHRGSWPLSPGDLTLVYFEFYADGSFGFHTPNGLNGGSGQPLDTLKASVSPVWDGYALLSPTRLSAPPRVTYQIPGGQSLSACTLYSTQPVSVSGGNLYIYILPNAALQTDYANAATVYQKLYCGGELYWYEPRFAAAVATVKDGETPSAPQTLRVRTPRHLYSLSLQSALWGKRFAQDLDMDYAAYRWSAAGLGNTSPVQPPIGNEARAFSGSYDGQTHAVRTVKLGYSGTLCGLFGTVGGTGGVSNLALSPAEITVPATAGAYVGLLAAGNSGTISGCTVTLPKSLAVGSASFGGLVGRNSGHISGCTVYGGAAGSAVTGFASVSGFAAETGGTVTDCAVRPADGMGYAGLTLGVSARSGSAAGFAGRVTGSVERSFAVATVTAAGTGSTAAGFALNLSPAAVALSSYANCDVSAVGSAAGFALTMEGSTAYCYALRAVTSSGGAAYGFAGTVSGPVTAAYSAASARGVTSYGFAAPAAPGGSYKDCFYLRGAYTGTQWGTAVEYSKLTAAACFGAYSSHWSDKGASFPFSAALWGKDYPFPQLPAPDHVGDWPLPSAEATGLVYFERYGDGSYGFFGLNAASTPISSLKGNDYAIGETGYGFLLPTGTAVPAFGAWAGDKTGTCLPGLNLGDGRTLSPFTPESYRYFSKGYNNAEIFVGSTLTYTARLDFAAAIAPRGTALGTRSLPLQVRTQAQLSHVGDSMDVAYILQTHDIPMDSTWTPLTKLGGQSRTLNGGGNRIIGLPQPLFGTLMPGSTLIDLSLTQANITTTGSTPQGILASDNASETNVIRCVVSNSTISGPSVGGMFGVVSHANSVITDCAVENVTVTSSASSGAAAGFAVTMGGAAVSGCRVAPAPGRGYDSMTVRATGSGGRAAGFAIDNQSSLKTCYASGTVSAPAGTASGFLYEMTGKPAVDSCFSNCITSGRTAAGFLAQMPNGTVTNSYALLSVDGSSEAYGFSGPLSGEAKLSGCYTALSLQGGTQYGFTPEPRSNNSITDCYYLSSSSSTQGRGTAVRYQDLSTRLAGLNTAAWSTPTADRSHPYSMPVGAAYPFPMLAALDHFGDWPLPGGETVIGLFRYVYDEGTGQLTVTAGSLSCELTDNGNKCSVELEDPKFLQSAQFVVPPGSGEADSLQSQGWGVFWSYGFDNFINENKKDFLYGSSTQEAVGDTAQDLHILPTYHFVPVDMDAPVLSFRHDGGSGWNWTRRFDYDAGTDSITIAEVNE